MYLYFNSNLTTHPFIKTHQHHRKTIHHKNKPKKEEELCHVLHQMLFQKYKSNQNLILRRQILARKLNLIKKYEH